MRIRWTDPWYFDPWKRPFPIFSFSKRAVFKALPKVFAIFAFSMALSVIKYTFSHNFRVCEPIFMPIASFWSSTSALQAATIHMTVFCRWKLKIDSQVDVRWHLKTPVWYRLTSSAPLEIKLSKSSSSHMSRKSMWTGRAESAWIQI